MNAPGMLAGLTFLCIAGVAASPLEAQQVKHFGTVSVPASDEPNDAVSAIAFSPDSKLLAAGNLGGVVYLYKIAGDNFERLPVTCTERGGFSADRIYFNRQGLIADQGFGVISFYKLSTGRKVGEIIPSDDIFYTALAADRRTLVASVRETRRDAVGAREVAALKLYDLRTGKQAGEAMLPTDGPHGVCIQPQGRQVAVAVNGRSVMFFDLPSLKHTETLEPRNPIRAFSYSPDGKQLLLACASSHDVFNSRPQDYEVWNLESGERTVSKAEAPLDAVAFSPNGKYFALAGGYDAPYVALCDAATGRIRQTLTGGPRTGIDSVAFSPDGKWLAAEGHSSDLKVHLWDVSALEAGVETAGAVAPVEPMPAAPAASLDEPFELAGHQGRVDGLVFLPDGKRLVSCSGVTPDFKPAGRIFVWDLATRRTSLEITNFDHRYGALVRVRLLPEPTSVAVIDGSGRIDAWDLKREVCENIKPDGLCRALDVTPDGKFYVWADRGDVVIQSRQDRQQQRRLQGHTNGVDDISVSSDGKYVASAEASGPVFVWDFASGNRLASLECSVFAGGAAAFAPAKNVIAYGARDADRREFLALYNVETKQTELRMPHEDSYLAALKFSPDGKLLAAGYGNGVVRVWQAATGKLLHKISAHVVDDDKRRGVLSLAFSPDSRLLATGGNDTLIKVFPMGGSTAAPNGDQRQPGTAAAGAPAAGATAVTNQRFRIWRSLDGKFVLRAKLVQFDQENVTLEDADGKQVAYPIKKLNIASRRYVNSLQK